MASYINYFNSCKRYEEIYGKQTVLLKPVGSFIELYEYISTRNNIDQEFIQYEHIGHCFDISNIIQFVTTSVHINKVHSINNPYVLGFIKKDKNKIINILLDNNYTVITLCNNDNVEIAFPKPDH